MKQWLRWLSQPQTKPLPMANTMFALRPRHDAHFFPFVPVPILRALANLLAHCLRCCAHLASTGGLSPNWLIGAMVNG